MKDTIVNEINGRTQNLAAATEEISASALEIRDIASDVKAKLEKLTEDWSSDDTHNKLHGKKILMAEDMMINAEIMKQLIQMKEAQIDHAQNGRIVLEMFTKSTVGYYDAVLMDVHMPEMDGLEATEAIRALDREDAKTVPIIALTANAFDEDVQRSLQAGMNAHLSKPVEPEHLYQTLEELIWDADKNDIREA